MMNKIILCLIFYMVFIPVSLLSQENDAKEIKGEFTIYSKILDEERSCLINLPESYANDGERTYPLLILLDGLTFFKTTNGIVHFMSSSRNRNYLMPKTIVVAIENVNRERDFTVTKIKTKRENDMGGGRQFLSFIENELIPYIDQHYRTEAYRTLVGHSLGGLLTVNAYMDEHSPFNNFLAIDPSIWWDEEKMKAKVDSLSPIVFKKKLFVATANLNPQRYEKNKKRHDRLQELLIDKSEGNFKMEVMTYDDEDHRSVPMIALYHGLKYLNEEY